MSSYEILEIETLSEFGGRNGVTKIIDSNCDIHYLSNIRMYKEELEEVIATHFMYDLDKRFIELINSNDVIMEKCHAGWGFEPPRKFDSTKASGLMFYDEYFTVNNKWYRHFHDNYAQYPSIKIGFGLRTIFDGRNYYVVDNNNNYVIAPGKYDYIDGFNKHGYTRVMVKEKTNSFSNDSGYRCGIVDVFGNIILPIEYTSIQSFYKGCKNNEIDVWEGGKDINDEYQSELFHYKFGILTKQLTQIGSCFYKRYEAFTDETTSDNSDEYSIWDAFEDNEEAAAAADFEW